MSCSSFFMFAVLFLYVLLIDMCGRLSWPALWSTFGRSIKYWLIVWMIDRSISKSYHCHHCIVLYTVYVFYVRTTPVRSQHVAPRSTLRNSRPRLLPWLPLPIPTPLKLSLLARAPACPRLRPRSARCCCCCCCCCRPAGVGTPYERRQNGWLYAETAGDCKCRWRIATNRI